MEKHKNTDENTNNFDFLERLEIYKEKKEKGIKQIQKEITPDF